MTIDPITDEERQVLSGIGRRFAHLGFEARLTQFLAAVDRETPGLPAAEREARARQLHREFMAAAGRKSGEVRRLKGAARRKGGTPRPTETS